MTSRPASRPSRQFPWARPIHTFPNPKNSSASAGHRWEFCSFQIQRCCVPRRPSQKGLPRADDLSISRSMSKRKAWAALESQPLQAPTEGTPNVWIKGLLSILIALHIAAVFVGPLAFACNAGRLPSPFVTALYGVFQPYIELMY